jgi:hypothetical protein
MKLKNITLSALLGFGLSGCVSLPPPTLVDRVKSDMVSAPSCAQLFLAGPVDCRTDRSLCVNGILSYQEDAQGPKNAAFTVFENEVGQIKGCAWSSAGFARGWEYVENSALASCEKLSVSTMSRTGERMKPCRVYARDNEIR